MESSNDDVQAAVETPVGIDIPSQVMSPTGPTADSTQRTVLESHVSTQQEQTADATQSQRTDANRHVTSANFNDIILPGESADAALDRLISAERDRLRSHSTQLSPVPESAVIPIMEQSAMPSQLEALAREATAAMQSSMNALPPDTALHTSTLFGGGSG